MKYIGHRTAKIFGLSKCHAKLIGTKNCVEFDEVKEALKLGYKPCSRCMIEEYKEWKLNSIPRRARDLLAADYKAENPSDSAIWSAINGLYMDTNKKDTTYKYVLLKSILDNIFNTDAKKNYVLSYDTVFAKFTAIYWNLVVKLKIRQMTRKKMPNDKVSEKVSAIEAILENTRIEFHINPETPFDNIDKDNKEGIKEKIIKRVKQRCKQIAVASLYRDTNELLYSFSKIDETIRINPKVYEFLRLHRDIIQRVNYFEWAKFLEKVNTAEDKEKTIGLLSNLEHIAKRQNLDIYRSILMEEFGHRCFYCGTKLGSNAPVDHVIPWDFVQDDKLWNFVLSCSQCNRNKSDKLPDKTIIDKVTLRNINNSKILELQCQKRHLDDMIGYDDSKLLELYECAKANGWTKTWESSDNVNEEG